MMINNVLSPVVNAVQNKPTQAPAFKGNMDRNPSAVTDQFCIFGEDDGDVKAIFRVDEFSKVTTGVNSVNVYFNLKNNLGQDSVRLENTSLTNVANAIKDFAIKVHNNK